MNAQNYKGSDDKVRYLRPQGDGVDDGGGPPHNGGMEARLTKLETQFETTIPTLATKADLADVRKEVTEVRLQSKADMADLRAEMHKGFSDMIKWIVGTAIVMGGTGLTVIAFVLNNATPKAPPQPPQPPTVIVVPAQAAPPVLAAPQKK